MSSVPARIFVYGTLMPGHLRWPMLASVAVGQRRADVVGTLYDTGLGWPAAHLGGGERSGTGLVPGWVVDVRRAAVEELLAVLDEVEDGFDRLRVTTVAGEEAWAYSVALPVPATWAPIPAWAEQPER